MTPVNFSPFKSQLFCNSQLLYGKKSRKSQRDKFININLQFKRYDIILNTIMFVLFLYRLLIYHAYVIIGYTNILETHNIFRKQLYNPEIINIIHIYIDISNIFGAFLHLFKMLIPKLLSFHIVTTFKLNHFLLYTSY